MTKTIFITGATAGIGGAAARKFAADGWRVIGTGRRRDRLDALADELGDRFSSAGIDMRDADALEPRSRASRALSGASTCCSTMPAWRRR